MGVYVVIYRGKDKNTTQGNLAELVGSPVAPIWCKWYYVKKKYKLNVNFSDNLCVLIPPTVPVLPTSSYTYPHIHWVRDIHNDYGFLRYYKRFLCTEILIDTHAHN